jgi:hypothetical protein
MKRTTAAVAITTLLAVSGSAMGAAQAHDHHAAPAGSAVGQLRGADLSELLKAGDASVRALQEAIRQGASQPAADLASQLMLLADSIAAYFDVDPPRPAKEAKRAEKALARQAGQLGEIAQTAPPHLQPAIEAAIDANRRASDVVEASTAATASASGAHHQGRSRGCGHH